MWRTIECPLCKDRGDNHRCGLCRGSGYLSEEWILLHSSGCILCGGSGWVTFLGTGAPDDPDHEETCPLCAVEVVR